MQVIIELDEEILRRLERVAPAKSRKRSAFIRAAIQKSLWELEEENTRQAYFADPDGEPAPLVPETWEAVPFGGFDPPERASKKEGEANRPRKKKRTARRRGR